MTDAPRGQMTQIDPFDLPEWLANGEVTWRPRSSVLGSHLVTGELEGDPASGASPLPCDLLAADLAYPLAALDDGWRRLAHEQWTHGQVLLLEHEGRLTLAVPGTAFTADRVLETLTRLARAVGVDPSRFVAALRL